MPVDPRVAQMVAQRAGRPMPAQAQGMRPAGMPAQAQGMPPPPAGMKKGGAVKNLFKGKESMSEELKEAKAIKSGKITPMQYAKGEKSEDKKKGKPFAKGGSVHGDGIAQRGKTRGKMC